MKFKTLVLAVILLSSSLMASPPKATETHRELQLENEHVKVWKTIIMPKSPLKMHRHDFDRVVVGLKGGTLKKIEESGKVSYIKIETGKAIFLQKDPPNTLHADINESNQSIEVIVIELKDS